MKSELREAFDLTFGLIAPRYYVLAAVVVIALFVFLRQNAVDYKVRMAQLDAKMRPIAAAFDIAESRDIYTILGYIGMGNNGPLEVEWHLKEPDLQLDEITIHTATSFYDSNVKYDRMTCEFKVRRVGIASGELMARGLYCLGFDGSVLAQLPPLSAHEKLELRLSLPREFWPQKWLDEENQPSSL